MNYTAIAALLAILLVGAYTLTNDAQTFSAVKFTNPDIEGSEAVGIVFTDAISAKEVLSQFTVETLSAPCDPAATSTPSATCETTNVSYKGTRVRVYAILPQNISEKFATEVGDFPFQGQLHYKELDGAKIDERVIKMMQEQGNKTYDVIYEK